MFENLMILLVIAFLCQYIAPTVGMGYGTTLAPILLIAGYEPLLLVPVILISQLFTGLISAVFHQRLHNMDLKSSDERSAVVVLGITGIIGVIISTLVNFSLPSFYIKVYIAITVVIAGVFSMHSRARATSFSVGSLTGIGIVAAFNKGLSGGAYGPISTAGQMLSGITPRAAIAITALVEGIICAAGVFFYLFLASPVDLTLLLGVTIGGIFAAPLSAYTTTKLEQERLKKFAGISIVLIGLISLIWVLLNPTF